MSKKNTELGLAIITLICGIGFIFANTWFMQQILNCIFYYMFSNTTYLSYKLCLAIYFAKSMFGLDYRPAFSQIFDLMYNKEKSKVYVTYIETFVIFFGYLFTWLIVTKIIF